MRTVSLDFRFYIPQRTKEEHLEIKKISQHKFEDRKESLLKFKK